MQIDKTTKPEQHRFHLLDALRGVAALLIIMRHTPAPYSSKFYSVSSFLAVDFFFCLSGFVIAFSYEKRLRQLLTFKQFTVARLIRIYPLAILGTVAGLVVAILLHTGPSPLPLKRLILEQGLGMAILPKLKFDAPTEQLFPLDLPMWTLFAELVGNFLYAALLRLRMAGTYVLLAVSLVSVALLSEECGRLGSLDLGWSTGTFHVGLLRVGTGFFAGVLVFRLYHHVHANTTFNPGGGGGLWEAFYSAVC